MYLVHVQKHTQDVKKHSLETIHKVPDTHFCMCVKGMMHVARIHSLSFNNKIIAYFSVINFERHPYKYILYIQTTRKFTTYLKEAV